MPPPHCSIFFFFNDTATTEIYTLSLHDALPISLSQVEAVCDVRYERAVRIGNEYRIPTVTDRSEEHTSELQSRLHLVCRLLLEKKKKNNKELVNTARSSTHQHRLYHATRG